MIENSDRPELTSLDGKRFLFITRKWPPAVGGMEIYSSELAAALGRQVRLDVRKLAGRSDGRVPSAASLVFFYLATAMFLLRSRGRYDVVHFGDFVLLPLAWWHSLFDRKAVRCVTVHGLDLIYGNRQGILSAIYRLYVGWARNRSCVDHFIANSRNTASIATQTGLSPVTPIPLGINIPAGHNPKPTSAPAPYILFIGRLVKRKGAAWFAEAVLPLLPPDVEFWVVGKAWDKEEHTRLNQCGRVKLCGFVADEELSLMKSGARVIVMPNLPSFDQSDVEGFGLVALEAAISGAPLVAAGTEGIVDAVMEGKTGFLLAPNEPEVWAKKIGELLDWTEEQRTLFIKTALENVRRHYSWERVAAETVGVYKKHLPDRHTSEVSYEL